MLATRHQLPIIESFPKPEYDLGRLVRYEKGVLGTITGLEYVTRINSWLMRVPEGWHYHLTALAPNEADSQYDDCAEVVLPASKIRPTRYSIIGIPNPPDSPQIGSIVKVDGLFGMLIGMRYLNQQIAEEYNAEAGWEYNVSLFLYQPEVEAFRDPIQSERLVRRDRLQMIEQQELQLKILPALGFAIA